MLSATVIVAEAIVAGQPNEIASLLRRYERWPGASSNRRVRKFERMYCRHLRLRGAFLQQGAIEFLASLEYGSAEDPISL